MGQIPNDNLASSDPGDENLTRDLSGRLWYADFNATSGRYEFWYSEDRGTTWIEAVPLRISGYSETDGMSLHINIASGVATFIANADTFPRWWICPEFSKTATWIFAGEDLTVGPMTNGGPSIVSFLKPSSTNTILACVYNKNTSGNVFHYSEWTNAGVAVSGNTQTVVTNTAENSPSYPAYQHIDFHHTGDGSTVANSQPDLYFTSSGQNNAGLIHAVWSDSWPYYTLNPRVFLSNNYEDIINGSAVNAVNQFSSAFFNGEKYIWAAKAAEVPGQSLSYTMVRVCEYDPASQTVTVLPSTQNNQYHNAYTTIDSLSVTCDVDKNIWVFAMMQNSDDAYYCVYKRDLGLWTPWVLLTENTYYNTNCIAVIKNIVDGQFDLMYRSGTRPTYISKSTVLPPAGVFVANSEYASANGSEIATASSGLMWQARPKYASFTVTRHEFWYSSDRGKTWTEASSLRITTSYRESHLVINTYINKAVFWIGPDIYVTNNISPTSTWTKVTGMPDGAAYSGGSAPTPTSQTDMIVIPHPTDVDLFFVVVSHIGIVVSGNNGSHFVNAYIFTINSANALAATRVIYGVASMNYGGSSIALEWNHNGDGSTPTGNPEIYSVLLVPQTQTRFTPWYRRHSYSGELNWHQEVQDIASMNTFYGGSYAFLRAIWAGGKLNICFANEAKDGVIVAQGVNDVWSNLAIPTSTFATLQSTGLWLSSVKENGNILVFLVNNYGFASLLARGSIYWIEYNAETSSWGSWEVFTHAAVLSYEINGQKHASLSAVPITWLKQANVLGSGATLSTEYRYMAYAYSFWNGSRMRIAAGTRALLRLANTLGSSIRLTDTTQL